MTRERALRPAVIGASAAALGIVMAVGGQSLLRTAVVLWFLGVCPGLAFVGAIRLADPWLEAALTLALSFAITVLVALVTAYGFGWSPSAALAVVVTLTLAGGAAQLLLPGERLAPRSLA